MAVTATATDNRAVARVQFYVNNVLKGKLLESEILVQQATNNTKEQFSNSPDLGTELMSAIMDAFTANTAMSTQSLDSERVRSG